MWDTWNSYNWQATAAAKCGIFWCNSWHAKEAKMVSSSVLNEYASCKFFFCERRSITNTKRSVLSCAGKQRLLSHMWQTKRRKKPCILTFCHIYVCYCISSESQRMNWGTYTMLDVPCHSCAEFPPHGEVMAGMWTHHFLLPQFVGCVVVQSCAANCVLVPALPQRTNSRSSLFNFSSAFVWRSRLEDLSKWIG